MAQFKGVNVLFGSLTKHIDWSNCISEYRPGQRGANREYIRVFVLSQTI